MDGVADGFGGRIHQLATSLVMLRYLERYGRRGINET